MNVGRIIWWLALIVLVLGCAGAVAITVWAYRGEGRSIERFADAVRPYDFSDLQLSDKEKAARAERAFLFKSWYVNHSILGDGITVVVILFSCFSCFLLTTCLIERRRIASKSQADVPSCKTDIVAKRVASLARKTPATSSEKPHGGS